MNHLQKFYEFSKFVNYLVTIYEKSWSYNFNYQTHLLKDIKLLKYHFSFFILTYLVVNWTNLHLKYYIESFYINIILMQNKFTRLS